ncbi:MAG: ABC transporter permease [Leptospirales bacterium]|nr:ABC transporter permease [Leptospirales bacterium]
MNHPIIQLVVAQLRGMLREPGIIFWAFAFPIVMAWILGIAFDGRGETKPTVALILAGQPGVHARKLQSSTQIQFRVLDREGAMRALKKGEIQVIVSEVAGKIKIEFDPANQEAATIHLKVERELSERKADIQIERLSAPGSRYIDFLLPGLLGMGVMNACMWGTGWVMIEFRIKKLLRAMVAASMNKVHFLLSFFIARVLANVVESGLLILFAYFYFGSQLQGSWLALVVAMFSGIVAFSGIAVLAASRANNTQIANGVLNAVTLPSMILSGVFFNYHNFPEWVVPFVQKLPLTLIADSVRSVFIEGAGVPDILLPSAILCAMGIVFGALGLRAYRWY